MLIYLYCICQVLVKPKELLFTKVINKCKTVNYVHAHVLKLTSKKLNIDDYTFCRYL